MTLFNIVNSNADVQNVDLALSDAALSYQSKGILGQVLLIPAAWPTIYSINSFP